MKNALNQINVQKMSVEKMNIIQSAAHRAQIPARTMTSLATAHFSALPVVSAMKDS